MKVMVCGAHFTPAVAVIDELKKLNTEIVYVGRQTTLEGDKTQSLESRILPAKGVKFIPITTGRLQRNFSIYTIFSLIKIPIGMLQAFYIIWIEKPDVVLSFGGYVALPIVFTSWLFSIPIIIHEQTLVAGLANKISSYFADKVAVAFIGGFKKAILTGNPLRREIIQISPGAKLIHPPRGKMPNILVMGGNQGSHIINLAIEGCLNKLVKKGHVFHQSGDSKFKDFERLSKFNHPNYQVFKFLWEGWEKILISADLVVSRAGINTLTELAFLGKPALVIPIPYLYNDEQNKNAKYFAKAGLVEVLPQSQLSSEKLYRKISKMLKNLSVLKASAMLAKSGVIPDAAKRLAQETVLLAHE